MRVVGSAPPGCRNPSSSSGILLNCSGTTTGVGNVNSFSVPLRNLPMEGVQVNLNFTVGTLVDSTGKLCTSGCRARPNSRLQVDVGFGGTETPCAGPSGETPADTGTTVAASLLCFPEAKSSDLTVSVLTNQGMSYDVNVWMERHSAEDKQLKTRYGGLKGASTMLVFTVAEEDTSTLERIKLRVDRRGNYSGYRGAEVDRNRLFGPERVRYLNDMVQDLINGTERDRKHMPPETSAYFFHEDSHCISGLIRRGGCANPDEVASCFSGARSGHRESLAHHINFLDGAELTLSSGSVPARQPGRWFVLLTCATHTWTNHSVGEAGVGCPETDVAIEWSSESNTGAKLWEGFWLMVFAPSVLLLGASFSHFLLCWLMGWVIDMSLEPRRQLPLMAPSQIQGYCLLVWERISSMVRRPQPRFAALLVLMVGVFCTTALQFVVTYWATTLRTADRNTCYYNYECYYPAFGFDLPVNNMISHVAYFLAGIHIFLSTLSVEYRCSLLAKEGVEPIDTSIFHALAVAVMCEGVGSMSYHLCPSVSTFQFDTAFMLPIAHLSMCALEEWQWPDEEPSTSSAVKEPRKRGDDSSMPFRYFLYIICPIWLFNFVGTWYDVNLLSKWVLYCALVCVVAFWAFNALGVVRRFLGIDFTSIMGIVGQALLQAYFALGLAAILMLDVVRDYLGGMANIFLLLSAVVMFVVVLYQWVSKDLVYSVGNYGRLSPSVFVASCLRMVLDNVPQAVFLASAVIAIQFFQHKTALVSPTASPALSRETNERCVFAQVFDNHDVWHFLSAIALAFWVMALLDVKVRIHMRKFEHHGHAPEASAQTSASTM